MISVKCLKTHQTIISLGLQKYSKHIFYLRAAGQQCRAKYSGIWVFAEKWRALNSIPQTDPWANKNFNKQSQLNTSGQQQKPKLWRNLNDVGNWHRNRVWSRMRQKNYRVFVTLLFLAPNQPPLPRWGWFRLQYLKPIYLLQNVDVSV